MCILYWWYWWLYIIPPYILDLSSWVTDYIFFPVAHSYYQIFPCFFHRGYFCDLLAVFFYVALSQRYRLLVYWICVLCNQLLWISASVQYTGSSFILSITLHSGRLSFIYGRFPFSFLYSVAFFALCWNWFRHSWSGVHIIVSLLLFSPKINKPLVQSSF